MARYLWIMILAVALADASAKGQPATAPAGRPTATTRRTIAVSLPATKTLPASPGFFSVTARVAVGNQTFPMAFGLFLSPPYFQDPKPFSVVMMLHNKAMEGMLYEFAMGYEKPATGAKGDAGAQAPLWGRAALTGAAIYWRVRKEHAS